MHRFSFLIITLIIFFSFSACTDTHPAEKKATDTSKGIEQFGDNKDFQDEHEIPAPITYKSKGKIMNLPTVDGKDARAYVYAPKGNQGKALFVFHEWWGLNEHIIREADRLADSLGDVMIIALDLYDGNVTDSREKAGELVQSVQDKRARTIISSGMGFAGSGARIATIGWCFGGGWSLKASIMLGNQGAGCVMYYGMPVENAIDLAPMKAAVLGIFADKDEWITPEVVRKFEENCTITRKNLTVKSYDADHAFANPSSPRYNEAAAKEANGEAVNFLKSKF